MRPEAHESQLGKTKSSGILLLGMQAPPMAGERNLGWDRNPLVYSKLACAKQGFVLFLETGKPAFVSTASQKILEFIMVHGRSFGGMEWFASMRWPH